MLFITATLGTVLDHLNKEGIVGKREVKFFDKVTDHLKNGAELLKEVSYNALMVAKSATQHCYNRDCILIECNAMPAFFLTLYYTFLD